MKRRGIHAGAVAGAVTIICAWAIETIYKVTIPAPVSSAATVLVTYLVSAIVPDRYEVDLQDDGPPGPPPSQP